MTKNNVIDGYDKTSGYDLENMFNIYKDVDGNYKYNINTTVYIDITKNFKVYVVKHPMLWTLISYDIFGTTRLAWLLMKMNKVKDPFVTIPAGYPVLYPNKSLLDMIILNINS